MIHLEVAVAAPVSSTLTYAPPSDDFSPLNPGIRLLVPLGRRQVTGYLLSVSPAIDTDFPVRRATDLLDRHPLFPENMVPLFRWIASYYLYPIGEVIKNALPGGLSPQSGRKIQLRETGLDILSRFVKENPLQPDWLTHLIEAGFLSSAQVRTAWKSRKWQKQLQKWQDAGALTIEDVITSETVKAKTEICAGITGSNISDISLKLKPSEQKTLNLLKELLSPQPEKFIARKKLITLYKGAAKPLVSLAEKNLITLQEKQILRDPFGEEPPFYPQPASLTTEQENVLSEIIPAIQSNTFTSFLLHGVTGSGKTEIYLQATEKTLQEQRSVLVLVPEIALASQLEAHFFSRFGKKVALLHSGLSQGERFDQWNQIMTGEAVIVIGARSAIFAPLINPGLIIVDEEHDSAYKQEDNLRYHARDLAVLRAKQQNCVVVLGSATPSLTSYYNSITGKYKLVALTKRIEERPLPSVKIIDLGLVKKQITSHSFFSQELLTALAENLAAQNQSIIFLNRRGYANLMICQDCGSTVKCRDCNISLTLHKSKNLLCCHHCGYTTKSAIICPTCSSANVNQVGFGTEKIEEALSQKFPEARIARMDRDTSTNRKKFLKILKAVHCREIDILIGTQMIAKGHHFPHVTLVGVIWADAGLGMPDYKAGERTFQLISQVTGRAGRGDKPGRVIIQTHQPGHFALRCAENHDYQAFYEKEMQLRSALFFPPLSRLVNLKFAGENEEKVKEAAGRIAVIARKYAEPLNIDVLGPASAPLSKIRNKYRWQLLLKGPDSVSLHQICQQLEADSPSSLHSHAVNMTMDIDPENML